MCPNLAQNLPRLLRPLGCFLLFALGWAVPARALPTLRAPLPAVLQTDVDRSGTVTCGDVLRYTLTIEPQTEFGTDLQNVVFDIVPDTNILFDPTSVVAVNSDQTVRVTADPLALRVELGRVCNSAGCPAPPARVTFDGQIRVLNTGSAVSIQGQISGSNFATTATDGTPDAAIEPTVTPFVPCPPTVILRATKSWSLVEDLDRDGKPDPGDSIRYAVQVQNSTSFVARGVRFDSGVDPNSALLVGSVTTSRGSVLLGNTAGNSAVRVQVGDLAGSASATITFDARIAAPFPAAATQIACQGTVSSTTGDFASFLTDDPSTPVASDPTRTTIDFDPDLALSKTDGGALAAPGQVVTYTLGITNLSRQGAANVTLSEALPTSATFSSTGSSPGWNCLGRTCTLLMGTVGPAASLSRTFAIRIDGSLPAGTSTFDNTARVVDDGTNGPEPNLKNNIASDSTPLDRTRARPDLSITKDDGGAQVRPGEIVTYSMRASNLGPLGASGVVLRETVPAHATFVAKGSSAGWSCPDGSPPGTSCSLVLGILNGGGTGSSRSATFAIRAASRFPAGVPSLSNTVRVEDDGTNGPDSDLANNSATDTTPLDGVAPNLKIAKRFDPASGRQPGEVMLWHLLWENTGNQDATGVTLSDAIPPYTTFEPKASSPGWTCGPGAATQTICTRSLGTVAAGSGGEAHLALRIANPFPAGVETLTNCAELGNPIIRAATACTNAAILADPDLILTKSDGGISTRAGETVAYVLQYQNRGNQGSRGVAIEETLPERTTFVAAGSTPGWKCSGRTCKLGVADLPGGASGSVTFAVRLDGSIPQGITQIVNAAFIADDGSSGGDLHPKDNFASDMTPILGAVPGPRPVLLAAKQDRLRVDLGTPGLADVGDRIVYTVLINNIGPGDALDVVFRSGTDPRTSLVAGSVTTTSGTIVRGNQANDGAVEVRIPTIREGQAAMITFEVNVDVLDTRPISCQGEFLAGNTAPGVTDDPDTPLPNDPTLTQYALPAGPAVDIPTLGELGLGLLILLLAGGAFPHLRRLEIPSIGER